MVLIKIIAIILSLIVFLRLKFSLYLSIFSITILSILLFQINIKYALISSFDILIEPRTLQLYVIIILVIYISSIQRSKGMFEKLIKALENLINDRRKISLILPAFIGFLPMPGGALFSAPLVEESLKGLDIKPEFKTFINYWFRHIWEFIWPIYAGLLFFQSLSGLSLKRIILLQLPFSVLNIILGIIITNYYFKKNSIKNAANRKDKKKSKDFLNIFLSMWPIFIVLLLFFLISMPLYLGLFISAFLLTIIKKVRIKEIIEVFFSKKIVDIMLLITVVMIFQQIIKISNISDGFLLFKPSIVIIVLISFFVSFSMGLLTGVNTAFIIIAYPILLPLISQLAPEVFEAISIYIYVTGFAGILLSPVHLCLVLTNEYFKSNIIKVYKYLIPPVLIMIIFATILMFISL